MAEAVDHSVERHVVVTPGRTASSACNARGESCRSVELANKKPQLVIRPLTPSLRAIKGG
jgi:hypothetical protein